MMVRHQCLVFITLCAISHGYAARIRYYMDDAEYYNNRERQIRSLLDAGAVVTKFREGLDMAGKFLGLNTAQGVAHLVSSSLLRNRPQWLREGDDIIGIQHGIFSGFFRLLGLDSTKLGAIALNAIIFIAQLISNSLVQPSPHVGTGRSFKKKAPAGSPLSWILENPSVEVNDLLKKAQEETLPDKVIRGIQERYTDDESGCVQLLVCKTSPFVWGMQKSIRTLLKKGQENNQSWSRLTPIQRMYNDLPSVKEVTEYGDTCEDRFPACRIFPTF